MGIEPGAWLMRPSLQTCFRTYLGVNGGIRTTRLQADKA